VPQTVTRSKRIERKTAMNHVAIDLGGPGEHSSSERQKRTGLTKAGPAAVRRMLIQGAWAAFRTRPNEPMVQWARTIAERRGKYIAIVALARKLAGIMFALWRDGTTYRASRSAAKTATGSTASG
jgi:transposase